MIKKLSPKAFEIIDTYQHLPLGNTVVQCPYFKNTKGIRAGLRVYLGKGSTTEIIDEVNTKTTIKHIDLSKLTANDVRDFMIKEGIGIDCSGFIAQMYKILDPKSIKKISSHNFFKHPWRALISLLRPVENISVKKLTNPENSEKLADWKNVLPGDIISTRGKTHALLVIQTNYNPNNQIKEITYAHSTSYYGSENGVRTGSISILYPKEELKDQNWTEKDQTGKNFTHEGFLDDDGTNGIYRLKHISF